MIMYTLSLLKVRTEQQEIINLTSQGIHYRTLSIKQAKTIETKEKPTNTDVFNARIKSAGLNISKLSPPQQQQLLRNIRKGKFETSAHFYWLKQKQLQSLNKYAHTIIETFTKK